MISAEAIRRELVAVFADLEDEIGPTDISVHWEEGPAIARVVLKLEHFTWDTRMKAIEDLLLYETAHKEELSLEFEINPVGSTSEQEVA